jgi:hypothetical protein
LLAIANCPYPSFRRLLPPDLLLKKHKWGFQDAKSLQIIKKNRVCAGAYKAGARLQDRAESPDLRVSLPAIRDFWRRGTGPGLPRPPSRADRNCQRRGLPDQGGRFRAERFSLILAAFSGCNGVAVHAVLQQGRLCSFTLSVLACFDVCGPALQMDNMMPSRSAPRL